MLIMRAIDDQRTRLRRAIFVRRVEPVEILAGLDPVPQIVRIMDIAREFRIQMCPAPAPIRKRWVPIVTSRTL